MAALKCFVYMCMCLAPAVHGYCTLQFDDVEDSLNAFEDETADIVCETDFTINRCEFTHPNGTRILITEVPGASSCKLTINTTISEHGIWTCDIWGQTYQEEIMITKKICVAVAQKTRNRTLIVGNDVVSTDDEPIVINTTTYVCSTIAFLIIFVALLYWKYKYYTLYYGKTWGDDDSINSMVMKIQADPTAVIRAGDHLLIT